MVAFSEVNADGSSGAANVLAYVHPGPAGAWAPPAHTFPKWEQSISVHMSPHFARLHCVPSQPGGGGGGARCFVMVASPSPATSPSASTASMAACSHFLAGASSRSDARCARVRSYPRRCSTAATSTSTVAWGAVVGGAAPRAAPGGGASAAVAAGTGSRL